MQGRLARVGAASLIVTVFALPTSSVARDAPWSKPQVVLEPEESVHDLKVGAGPRWYAVAGWISGAPEVVPAGIEGSASTDERRVWLALRGKQQKHFRPPQAVSEPGARSLQIGVAPNGQTVVAWVDADDQVRALFRKLGGRWSAPQVVGGSVAGGIRLAVGADGTAIVAWRTPTAGMDRIHVAARAPNEAFAAPATVPGSTRPGNLGPIAVAGREGRGFVLWSGACPLDEPSQNAAASFVYLLPGGTGADPAEQIPNSKCPPGDLAGVMADDGGALVVLDGPRQNGRDGVKASLRPPGGTFSKTRFISRRSQDSGGVRLGMTGSGRVFVLWTIREQGAPRGVEAAFRPPGGPFTAPRLISGRKAGLHDAGVSRRGHVLVVWRTFGTDRLLAAYKPRGRWFGTPERFPPRVSEGRVVVAINRGGKAIGAWSEPQPRRGPAGVFVSNRR